MARHCLPVLQLSSTAVTNAWDNSRDFDLAFCISRRVTPSNALFPMRLIAVKAEADACLALKSGLRSVQPSTRISWGSPLFKLWQKSSSSSGLGRGWLILPFDLTLRATTCATQFLLVNDCKFAIAFNLTACLLSKPYKAASNSKLIRGTDILSNEDRFWVYLECRPTWPKPLTPRSVRPLLERLILSRVASSAISLDLLSASSSLPWTGRHFLLHNNVPPSQKRFKKSLPKIR